MKNVVITEETKKPSLHDSEGADKAEKNDAIKKSESEKAGKAENADSFADATAPDRKVGFAAFVRANWFFGVCMLICLSGTIIHAINNAHYVNFLAFNGDFQNFNPIRRFLSGEVPYRDFQDYLGLGHLYFGSIATFLFGGNFAASLTAFSFLTFLSFLLLSLVAGRAILGSKKRAAAVTVLMSVFFLLRLFNDISGIKMLGDIFYAFENVYDQMISARMLRGAALPLSCCFIWIMMKLRDRLCGGKNGFFAKHKELVNSAIIGIAAGSSFIWSNDYGVSCCACLFVMTLWYYLCKTRNIKTTLLCASTELGFTAVSLLVFVEVYTLGHLPQWITATFGTGSYQSWYYLSDKSMYLWQLESSPVTIVQSLLVVYYLLRILYFKDREHIPMRFVVPAYLNMVCFCAAHEYRMLSGGHNTEVAIIVLMLTVLYELAALTANKLRRRGFVIAATSLSLVLGCACIAKLSYDEINFRVDDKKGVYVAELGGYNTELGEDILKTKEFLGNEKFFSTYASAQETVSDIFQPSGTDYIIHVLGDKQRDDYLESFRTSDFRYSATLQKSYTKWEYWIARANWFFYRELYKNWHPVYGNKYELYWERNTEEDQNVLHSGFKLTIEETDEANKKIIVDCDEPVNGTADIYIDYEVVNSEKGGSLFNFRKMLSIGVLPTEKIKDKREYDRNFLPAKSAEYIPMTIENGHGELYVNSAPAKDTAVKINECYIDSVLTVYENSFELKGFDSSVMSIAKNEHSENVVKKAKALEYAGKRYDIVSFAVEGTDICIRINGLPEKSENNMVTLIF